MPVTYPLVINDFLTDLRADLSDTISGSTTPRWSDTDLTRALDRSLNRYSQVSPNLQAIQIAASPQINQYPIPPGAWYVDAVEYPFGLFPKVYCPFIQKKSPQIPNPAGNATITLATAPGGMVPPSLASFAPTQYTYTFLTAGGDPNTPNGGGETTPPPGPFPGVVVVAPSIVVVSGIPTGPYGTVARNIYRSRVTGGLALAGQIPDNTSSSFTDNTPDSLLLGPLPATNTTGGQDIIELTLDPSAYPTQRSDTLELLYATGHTLDVAGTSVPQRHWPVLFQGAQAYAVQSYIQHVADNFEWVDGHLRDRVDDTKSAIIWQKQSYELMQRYDQAIKLVKEESNAFISSRMQWGDTPLRWNWT